MIPRETIQAILEVTDIVKLLRDRGVDFQEGPKSLKANCPIHGGKAPTFYVWTDKQRFKCFGCQSTGDAITLLQQLERLSFADAVDRLAKAAGARLLRA